MSKPRVIHLVAAARPNFMKIAPLYHALVREPWCEVRIVHTGQHYDANMSDAFFRDLRLPAPHIHLGVGSGSHAEQTGGVMMAYEKICMATPPDCVIVVGDVNSTAACAMVATKLHIPVVHLEAGLRSRDRRMPEEINRLVTDAISDLMWTPSPDADDNLLAEGVPASRIERVGNIMLDSFEMVRNQITLDSTRADLGLEAERYAVVTLHRPSNVDNRDTLAVIIGQLVKIAEHLQLVFAVHPRTRKRLEEFGLYGSISHCTGIIMTEPLGYIQFMNLVCGARAVVTDSGGVQEESTYLGIPCMTLRENTERPITVTHGSNRLTRPDEIETRFSEILAGQWPTGRRPELWDGQTAQRCTASLRRFLAA